VLNKSFQISFAFFRVEKVTGNTLILLSYCCTMQTFTVLRVSFFFTNLLRSVMQTFPCEFPTRKVLFWSQQVSNVITYPHCRGTVIGLFSEKSLLCLEPRFKVTTLCTSQDTDTFFVLRIARPAHVAFVQSSCTLTANEKHSISIHRNKNIYVAISRGKKSFIKTLCKVLVQFSPFFVSMNTSNN
jgi:hypothetical protein